MTKRKDVRSLRRNYVPKDHSGLALAQVFGLVPKAPAVKVRAIVLTHPEDAADDELARITPPQRPRKGASA
jgi:hypothetical protein